MRVTLLKDVDVATDGIGYVIEQCRKGDTKDYSDRVANLLIGSGVARPAKAKAAATLDESVGTPPTVVEPGASPDTETAIDHTPTTAIEAAPASGGKQRRRWLRN